MKKEIILFINKIEEGVVKSIKEYAVDQGKEYDTALLLNTRTQKIPKDSPADIILSCDFTKLTKIYETLKVIKNQIIGVTCLGERNIGEFEKVIPHLPYIRTPNAASLQWATNKIIMRELFQAYNKKISPKFCVIKNGSENSLALIKKKVGFPLVLKPAGLASSLLVTICFHEEDVSAALKKMFNRIQFFYKQAKVTKDPVVLVEQFMEGEMYSIDAYINHVGNILFCPFVHIKTGRTIGFDDFFGYKQMTPTTLTKEEREKGKNVAMQGVYALGLRNTTAHVELMKTDLGWKIIEIGSRIGGFRHLMYQLSYGINHRLNDVLVRIGKKPIISTRLKGYTILLKMFSSKEGKLEKINGLRKIRGISSLHRMEVNLKREEQCKFAKNGGKSVVDIMLCNKNKSDLLADVRRVETSIEIIVS